MDKEYILNHVEELSAEQLFGAIRENIVSEEELRETGNLDATKRRAVKTLQKEHDMQDDEQWDKARYTEQGCRNYLTNYPNGRHVQEARKKIDEFERQRELENTERNRILDKLRKNPNSLTPGMLNKHLKDNSITKYDLLDIGIPDAVIDRLNNIVTPTFELGKTPDFIPEGFTEVYFWGIPGSGKTCALAAVLSTANRLGLLEIAQGPAYNYMLKLQHIFSNKISYLPAANPHEPTSYLPFALKKPHEKFSRSISLIEMSGEIFQGFLYKIADLPFPSTSHEKTFNTIINYLNGNNRKIHFFFIDYDVENIPDQNGYCQSDYLNAAATFFNDRNNNLFSKNTDAIYIVLTKSDLMPCESSERTKYIKDHLQDNNFQAFVNSLKDKCRKNSINSNKLLATPFALGKVYFNHICDFDPETANNIIDILMRRIKPKKTSILDVFNK